MHCPRGRPSTLVTSLPTLGMTLGIYLWCARPGSRDDCLRGFSLTCRAGVLTMGHLAGKPNVLLALTKVVPISSVIA